MAQGRWLRIYYQDLAIEYPAVWKDLALLGAWVHLLAEAEDAWPRRPACPSTVDEEAFAQLVAAGLISGDASGYVVKGLDRQRRRMSEAGRAAALARWGHGDAAAAAERTASDPHAVRMRSAYGSHAGRMRVASKSHDGSDAVRMRAASEPHGVQVTTNGEFHDQNEATDEDAVRMRAASEPHANRTANAMRSASEAHANHESESEEKRPSTGENVDSVLVPLGARRTVLSRGQSLTESGADDDELASVEAWMAQRRLAVDPVSRAGTELARLVDRFGAKAVIDAMEGLGALHDGRQAVYGALRVLAPIPSGKPRRDHRPSVDDLAGL
jgi:hypothetical protein